MWKFSNTVRPAQTRSETRDGSVRQACTLKQKRCSPEPEIFGVSQAWMS